MAEKHITLHQVSKSYKTKAGWNHVLSDISFRIHPNDKLGILGRNGAGKSTLLRLIGGSELPSRGYVERTMSVSWPVGFNGHLQSSLSGRTNTKFCARIYNRDPEEVIDFVRDFSELGAYFEEPTKTYSSGMRARLGFALSMAIEFDCLLIDEATAVGDASFREKSHTALAELSSNRAFVLVNHGLHIVRKLCNRVMVLGVEEQPFLSDDVDAVVDAYKQATLGEPWQRPEAA